MTLGLVLTLSFIGFIILGVPVAISIGMASLAGMLFSGMSLQYIAKTAYSGMDSFSLIAVPMFILSGALMERVGITEKLIKFSRSIVGKSPGGLAVVTILSCTLFAAISGSGAATTAAIGAMLIPAMIRENYKPAFAGAVTACSGGLGVVIPPSITMIIYGITAEVSITKLFVAGVFPGILLALFLYVTVVFISRRRNYRSEVEQRSLKTVLHAMYDAKWALLAPILILGGIYGGLVTVTEASIIAVIYPILVGLFITRRLSLKSFQDSLFYTGKIVGTVLIILTTGTLFGKILAMNQIPQRIAEYLVSTFQSPVVLLLLVNVLLLFVGMWMETITQIIILTPLLLPVVVSAGIDPIQFGVMFVVVCEIGYETPPLGVNLFVAQEISDCSIEAISKEAIPFALAEFAALMIITFVPQLTLFLPSLL